ncbi:protein LRATD1 [Callorhinchus milii]|nr:protein LRATD1 [Callorhinchus milii]XP_042189317.1 protein LRATD1 [Callorhinchus milii]|eukprot:gi/632958808/ref/XP_007895253.1/ PREDICTED: protein FAM84A [Callorhinchus milii]
MGNQIDRITHLNYSELPTGDPSGVEKEELRVGVAYFFSDEEDDMDERSQTERQWEDQSPRKDEALLVVGDLEYSAFSGQECIFSKLRGNEDLNVSPVKALLSVCKAGDLVELAAGDQPGHWALYVGDGQVIHLHKQEIRRDRLSDVGHGRLARIVNSWYRYRALPADLVVQNAREHVGLSRQEICWTNSESFAAWCRFGKREFKAGGEVHTGDQHYFLKIHLAENCVHTLKFGSLEELIREKHRRDASGKLGVLKELSVLNHK